MLSHSLNLCCIFISSDIDNLGTDLPRYSSHSFNKATIHIHSTNLRFTFILQAHNFYLSFIHKRSLIMKFNYLLALASATIIGASPLVAEVARELSVEDDWMPSLRLSRREVEDMKANLEHPAGSVIGNATFPDAQGKGKALTFPVVLVDPEWLLEGSEGDRKREMVRRQSWKACFSYAGLSNQCAVSYCWYKTDDHALMSTHVTIKRFPNPFGTSYSLSVPSGDVNKIDPVFVDRNHDPPTASTWEPGHKCEDPTPFVHTVHRMKGNPSPFQSVGSGPLLSHVDLNNGKAAWAKIGRVNCRTCSFNFWACQPGGLQNNMLIFTNGASTGTQCN